ncbi:MAG: aldose 1-epimerase [Acidimicrobiales bacterium]|nr:aldose 1-epimerase [Acidimicrobiales bacterium]
MKLLELDSATAHVSVDAHAGGRLSSLVVHGLELLVAERDDPLAWGSYPMIPFAGRIRRGQVAFRGTTAHLPLNAPPHAMHGYGFVSEWEQTTDNELRWVFAEPWPWAGEARQRFDLTDTGLELTMTIHADEAQPVSAGWHPWFRRVLDDGSEVELEAAAPVMYELDDESIPNGRLIAPPPGPWDNCFTELTRLPVLRWGNLEVRLSSTADHWVIYNEPTHALCVEPQTGPPNDVNFAPLVLDAGSSMDVRFTMTWG